MGSRGELQVLLGYEGATPGTPVTPDTAWEGTCTLQEGVDRQFPDLDVGRMSKNYRDFVQQRKSTGTLSAEAATYEQIIIPLAMVIEDTTPGAGPPYTWTFNPNLAVHGDPATFTAERGISTKGYRTDYVFGTSITLAGEAASAWSVEAAIAGGEVSSVTLASGISVTDKTYILTGETGLYINDAWADLGNTTVSGYLINFEWSLEGYHQKQFIDDSMEPTSHGLDKRSAQLVITVEWNAAQEAAERGYWRDGTARFIRIQAANGTNVCRIDGCYKIVDVAPLDNREGNITAVYTLESEYDQTSENEYEVVVINTVDSL